jgi:hypothetical protein
VLANEQRVWLPLLSLRRAFALLPLCLPVPSVQVCVTRLFSFLQRKAVTSAGMRWAALFLGMRLLAGVASLSPHEFGVPSSSRGKGTASRPSSNIQMLRLRGGGVPMEEGGTRDNQEYFAAGKTIRNSQHIVDEWIEHNFPLQNRKEWGHACLGLGACCIVLALAPLPLLNCFLSRKMLLAANILITGGAFLVSGPTSIRRFLFAPRRRLGTVILFAGFTMVWRRWTILVCVFVCVRVGVHCTLLYL